jgi:hypothetical protein
MSVTAEQTDDALFSTSFEASMNKESDFGIGWRRPFFYMHIYHIPIDLEERLLSGRAAHDQYTTIPKKCHVVHNRLFSQNALNFVHS